MVNSRDFIAPESEIQKKLAAIWGKVLGVEPVGLNDNFIILGGDSIKIFNAISIIKETLNIDVTFEEFMRQNFFQFSKGCEEKLAQFVS